jgi:hypothetical protein
MVESLPPNRVPACETRILLRLAEQQLCDLATCFGHVDSDSFITLSM